VADGPEPAIRVFLIADIRGYTRFTYEHGDEAAAELAVMFGQVVTRVVSEFGGAVLEFRGDEALAVFASARQAVRSALALQEEFGCMPTRHHPTGLPVIGSEAARKLQDPAAIPSNTLLKRHHPDPLL